MTIILLLLMIIFVLLLDFMFILTKGYKDMTSLILVALTNGFIIGSMILLLRLSKICF